MDLALFGRYFLDFALLYPSAFLCLAALWEKLRTPKRTACIAAGCITLLCIGCAALCTVFGLNSNAFLPVIVLVSFWLLRWRVTPEVTVSQTAFLFSISAVMMAVRTYKRTLRQERMIFCSRSLMRLARESRRENSFMTRRTTTRQTSSVKIAERMLAMLYPPIECEMISESSFMAFQPLSM